MLSLNQFESRCRMELILLLSFSLGRIKADEIYLLSDKEYRFVNTHFGEFSNNNQLQIFGKTNDMV